MTVHERAENAGAAAPVVLVYRSGLLHHSETFIKEQIRACRAWRPILVGRRNLNELPLDGLDIRLLRGRSSSLASRARARLQWTLGYPPGLKRLSDEKPRLVHAHFGLDAIEAQPIAKRLRLPMAVTLHGYDINISREWWEAGHGGSKMRRYPARLLKLAQQEFVHFIAVSEAIRREAIRFGVPASKIRTCYIGLDVTKFKPGPVPISERGPRVLFVGRLVEKKGCEYLIRAMQHVKSQIPDAELTIVGNGPLREKLEAASRELSVRARFLGTMPSDKIRAEFDKARVLCLPSIRAVNGDAEGFGLVLLEAQASGIPVVTSAMGGAEEGILDAETGYRVDEKDVNGLSQRLSELLLNDETSMRMAGKARKFTIERFDIRNCTRELERRYDEISGAP